MPLSVDWPNVASDPVIEPKWPTRIGPDPPAPGAGVAPPPPLSPPPQPSKPRTRSGTSARVGFMDPLCPASWPADGSLNGRGLSHGGRKLVGGSFVPVRRRALNRPLAIPPDAETAPYQYPERAQALPFPRACAGPNCPSKTCDLPGSIPPSAPGANAEATVGLPLASRVTGLTGPVLVLAAFRGSDARAADERAPDKLSRRPTT